MKREFDCVIIGSGPAGLTAAIYLARFHLDVLVIGNDRSRARLIPLAHNHAGFPDGISGHLLLGRMRDQAARYGASLVTDLATSVMNEHGAFRVQLTSGAVQAHTILLATGVVDRKLDLADALHDEALAKGLLRYCPICDGYEVTDRSVAVVGTGKHGFDEALFLRAFTRTLTLISPGRTHDLTGRQRNELAAAEIALMDGPCSRFAVASNRISLDVPRGRVSFEALYSALGCEVRSELARALDVECSPLGCVVVDRHQRTDKPGFYAAGDVVLGLDQISNAVGQGAVAGVTMRNDLAKRRSLQR